MTINPARLGRRQVDVLCAAKDGKLVRHDDGGWVGRHAACTRAAESVARLGLLVDGKRMATVTFGRAGARFGYNVHLSPAGEQALDGWELAHPQQALAEIRRTELIRALAAKPGEITGGDLVELAAKDELLDDDTFTTLRPFLEGRDVDLPHGGGIQ